MPPVQKIVQSGLRPAAASHLEGRVLQYTEEICQAFIAAAAYLRMPLRTLQSLTGPKKPTLPFCWIGGKFWRPLGSFYPNHSFTEPTHTEEVGT